MSTPRIFFKLKDVVPVQFLISSRDICWLKLLKIRCYTLLFVLNSSVGRNRNWTKWSEIGATMFPEIAFSDISFEKILSIKLLEHEMIGVWGTKEVEYIWSRESVALWSFSYFSKSMLKWPNKTVSLFFF